LIAFKVRPAGPNIVDVRNLFGSGDNPKAAFRMGPGIHNLSALSASSRSKLLRTRWKAIDTTDVQPSVKRKRKADYWNERDDDWNDKERNSIEQ
jgi:hypothetical protein